MDTCSLLFLSSAEISLPLLKVLAKDEHFHVAKLICQPDKPAGREMKMVAPMTKIVAGHLGIEVLQPENLNIANDLLRQFKENPPDILLTFAYGQILNEEWLMLPSRFALNIHASLLPKYRGASPISAAILNGDEKTGVSLMKMEKGMDTGPVAFEHEIAIPPHMTADILHDEIADLAAKVIPEDLVALMCECRGDLFKAQDASLATYTKKLSREDGEVKFSDSAELISRKFRAFTPWPGLYTFFKGKRLKFLDLEAAEEVLSPSEVKVIDGKVYVGTSDGSIHLKQVQMEGKNAMHINQFLLGFPEFDGGSLPS